MEDNLNSATPLIQNGPSSTSPEHVSKSYPRDYTKCKPCSNGSSEVKTISNDTAQSKSSYDASLQVKSSCDALWCAKPSSDASGAPANGHDRSVMKDITNGKFTSYKEEAELISLLSSLENEREDNQREEEWQEQKRRKPKERKKRENGKLRLPRHSSDVYEESLDALLVRITKWLVVFRSPLTAYRLTNLP